MVRLLWTGKTQQVINLQSFKALTSTFIVSCHKVSKLWHQHLLSPVTKFQSSHINIYCLLSQCFKSLTSTFIVSCHITYVSLCPLSECQSQTNSEIVHNVLLSTSVHYACPVSFKKNFSSAPIPWDTCVGVCTHMCASVCVHSCVLKCMSVHLTLIKIHICVFKRICKPAKSG